MLTVRVLAFCLLSVQPICSPTRSVLMSGRYTYRVGTQATVIRADVPFGVPLDNTFLPQNLKDAGYHTGETELQCRER